MSDFYLIHNTSIDSANNILTEGVLKSSYMLHKMDLNKKTKKRQKGGEFGFNMNDKYIYTILLPKENFEYYFKRIENYYNTTFVFDAALLLTRNFIFNISWEYGKVSDSHLYKGKNMDMNKLNRTLKKIHEFMEETRVLEDEASVKERGYKPGDAFRYLPYYGELMVKSQINLSKYLKYIYAQFKEGYDADNNKNMPGIQKVIKSSSPYSNVKVIIYYIKPYFSEDFMKKIKMIPKSSPKK